MVSTTESESPTIPSYAAELGEFVREYLIAFNSGNAKKLADFYAEQAIAVPPRGPELRGKTEILAYYLGTFRESRPQLFDYEPEWEIEGNRAVAREAWAVSLTEGRALRKLRTGWGMWTAVRDSQNQWKLQWILARFADLETPQTDEE